jgi:hypothetical protein
MKKAFLFSFFWLNSQLIFAQNEIGPEGGKLIWVPVVLAAVLLSFFLIFRKKDKSKGMAKKPLFQNKKVKIELDKDRVYYPDSLNLTVKNTGNSDIDLDKPLLILDNFWLKRKFKLKGMGNRTFYPLFLEKGKSHQLQIDLSRFYSHDKSLKKFPKAKVLVFDVQGKKLGSKSVFLRKTLFKF